MSAELDEDDWIDLEKAEKAVVATGDVTIKLSRFKNKGKARAFLCFRNEPAQWIAENGPRFRVQVGGVKDDVIRIVPDIHKGRYENLAWRGVQRLILGHVDLWPDEIRDSVSVEWDAAKGWLKLKLPAGFTDPREESK